MSASGQVRDVVATTTPATSRAFDWREDLELTLRKSGSSLKFPENTWAPTSSLRSIAVFAQTASAVPPFPIWKDGARRPVSCYGQTALLKRGLVSAQRGTLRSTIETSAASTPLSGWQT